MRDVGERAAVDERRRPLARLHEVRADRVVEDRHQRPRHAHLAGEHGLAARGVADEDAVEPGAEVGAGVGQAEDGHDLARRRDVEPRLARHAALPGPPRPRTIFREARSFMSSAPLPDDVAGVERGVAEVEAVVDRRGEQVVRGGDRVEVAGELEVDRVRRLDPARPAAGRPPLRPKTGPIDGCLSAIAAFLPILRSPCASPIDVVVFPSPAGVGVIAETRISLPGGLSADARSSASRRTFALSRPYGSRWSGAIPRSRATSAIGRSPGSSGLPCVIGRAFQSGRMPVTGSWSPDSRREHR